MATAGLPSIPRNLHDAFWNRGPVQATSREQGSSSLRVAESSIPTGEAVAKLATAMGQLPKTRTTASDVLAVWVAAYSGVRLRRCSIFASGTSIPRIEGFESSIQAVGSAAAPRGHHRRGKFRTTLYPAKVPNSDYDLARQMRRQVQAARRRAARTRSCSQLRRVTTGRSRVGARRFPSRCQGCRLADAHNHQGGSRGAEAGLDVALVEAPVRSVASVGTGRLPRRCVAADGPPSVAITMSIYAGGTADAVARIDGLI